MLALKPSSRRPEFDEITQGWGADRLADLWARCELLAEFYQRAGGYTAAELKIANAMARRARELGGATPAVMP